MKTSAKPLFPYFLLISLLGIAGSIIQRLGELGMVMNDPLAPDYLFPYQWLAWGSSIFFALSLYLLRNIHYRELFRGTLIVIALLLIAVFARPEVFLGHLIFASIIPKLLMILGWAYTNQHFQLSEGKKQYFFLFFFTACVLLPFTVISKFANVALMFFYNIEPNQAGSLAALLALFLAWICEKWIYKKQKISSDKIIHLTFSRYRALISFAALFIGLQLIIRPFFHSELSSSFTSFEVLENEVSNPLFLPESFFHWELLGALLLTWIGPVMIRRFGWSVSYLWGMLASLTILVVLLFKTPQQNSKMISLLTQEGIGSVQLLWIFPLMQIAFLSITSKYRFGMQLTTLLVLAPVLDGLISLLWKYGHFFLLPDAYYYTSIGISIGILIAMYLCLRMLTKKSTGLT